MLRALLCMSTLAATVCLAGCLEEGASDGGGRLDGASGAVDLGSGVVPDRGIADAAPRDAEAGEGCVRTVIYRAAGSAPAEVRLAASFEFQPWSGAVALADPDGDGWWTVNVRLRPGRYRYKFIVDGAWIADPDNPDTEPNELGGVNSVMAHACPFEPRCLRDEHCAEPAPLCRYYRCLSEEPPPPCDCPPGQRCDEAGACVATPPPAECDESRPCEAPLVCSEGACGPECVDDAGCPEGDLCRDLVCVTPRCETDADCADPLAEICDGVACAPNPCPVQVFRYTHPGAQPQTVHLAGTFNADPEGRWPATVAAGGWPMRFDEALGAWVLKRALANGIWAYKFVINEGEAWITDPDNPDTADDGLGGLNSLLTVDCAGEGPGACGDLDVFDWRDAVMYFVMVDRFFDSDGRVDPVPGASGGDATRGASGQYEGGDLAGVTARLPYLAELGVTALWLSAPYDNRDSAGAAIDPQADGHLYSGYHGYWPSPANVDYSDPDAPAPLPAVESRIGDAADLHALVGAAHDAGVRVLFDYVMNHVDADSGLYQAHRDWFATDNGRTRLCGPENLWDDGFWGTRCGFTDYLPPFDFDNPAARAWSVADAMWWARTYGIDGYRLDAIKHVPLAWLTELRAATNQAFPEPEGGRFYLVGETFAYDDAELIRSFVDPARLLDGQFDFPFKARLCDALFRPDRGLDAFARWMAGNADFYGPGAIMTTWIGNHDIPRAIHFASGQIGDCRAGSHPGNGWTADFPQPDDPAAYERLGLAFAVMMTNPGIPLIYYGDEVGLAGGGDPDNRRMMPWGALAPAQEALREQVAWLARVRAENKVLARGRRVRLSADQDTWVFRMTGCGAASKDVTVAINRADAPRPVQVPAGDYTDLLSDSPVQGGRRELPPRSVTLLRAR